MSDCSEKFLVPAALFSTVVSMRTMAEWLSILGVVTDTPQCAMRKGSVMESRTLR